LQHAKFHLTVSTEGRQAKSMGVPNFLTPVAQKPLDQFW